MMHDPEPDNPYAAPRALEVRAQSVSEIPDTADAWDRVDVLRTTLAMVHRRFFWLLGGWFIILIEAAAFAVTLYFIFGLGGAILITLVPKFMPWTFGFLGVLLAFVVQFLVQPLVIGRGTSLHLQVLSGERPSLTRGMYIGRRYPQLVVAHLPIGPLVLAWFYTPLASALLLDPAWGPTLTTFVMVVFIPAVATALFSWFGFSYAWVADPANHGWKFWQASLALTRGRRGRIFRFTVLTIVVITGAELVLMIAANFASTHLNRHFAHYLPNMLIDQPETLPSLIVLCMQPLFCIYVTMLYTVYYAKLARHSADGVLTVARDRGT